MRFKGYYVWGQYIYGQDFHEMHARSRGLKSLLPLYQYYKYSQNSLERHSL